MTHKLTISKRALLYLKESHLKVKYTRSIICIQSNAIEFSIYLFDRGEELFASPNLSKVLLKRCAKSK